MKVRCNSKDMDYWAAARSDLALSNCFKPHACVLVKNDQIISGGHTFSSQPCTVCKRTNVAHNTGDYSTCHTIHAEQMAMLRAVARTNVKGAVLYLIGSDGQPTTPCPQCSNMLAYLGIILAKPQ